MTNSNFYVYKADGQIIKIGNLPESDIPANLSPGESYNLGVANINTQYVDNGILIDMPPKPSGFYEFDYQTKSWVVDTAAAEASVKAERDKLLLESDWTQLPDVPLTNKAEWAAYRQELRDIPEQSGYPTNVVWPVAPAS